MHRIGLHNQIFIAMALGVALGLAMNLAGDPAAPAFAATVWWLDLAGKDLFIGALKMIIAPLIFASIIAGVYSLPNLRAVRSIGVKTLAFYACTVCVAVALGMTLVMVIQPGNKSSSQQIRAKREAQIAALADQYRASGGADPATTQGAAEFRHYLAAQEGEASGAQTFGAAWPAMKAGGTDGSLVTLRDALVRPSLTNPFNSLAQIPPNSLGIIVFALVLGVALVTVGEAAKPVGEFFVAFDKVMLIITMWIMKFAPIGVGCITASLVATLGVDALVSLAWYSGVVVVGLTIHFCFLLFLTWAVGGMGPVEFLRGARDALLVAFTTSSSAATLPVTMLCTIEKLKVSPHIARFALPVGATVNMDGTALYEGVAVLFLIQVFGGLPDAMIDLSFGSLFVIFITAVFAAVGAAAVPSAGLITMALVAGSVGLPIYYIVIIYAVDRVLDMFRTTVNVLGDLVGAVIVNRLEAKNLGEAALSSKP